MTVVVGVAFIIAVSQVYYGGLKENPDYPFEIERIKDHILVPFVILIIWIYAIIGGAVVSIAFPLIEKKKPVKDNAAMLKRLCGRMPSSGGEEYTAAKRKIAKYGKIRIIVWSVTFALFLAAAIVIFVYAFNITHYHADALKKDILGFVKNVLTWTAAALVAGISAVIVDEVMLKREVAAAVTAVTNGDKSAPPLTKEVKKSVTVASAVVAAIVVGAAIIAYILAPMIVQSVFTSNQTAIYVTVFVIAALITAGFTAFNILKDYVPDKMNKVLLIVARAAVGVIAVTFIVVGAVNGGANDVLVKAINICTECIGLG